MCNYQKVILLNLKMFLFVWWPIFFAIMKDSITQNLFKSLIFSKQHSSSEIWDCQWHKTFNVTPVFTALILLLLFQIIKICQCCGFIFRNFFFFLMATNAFVTSWVKLSNTRIIKYFSTFLIWFFHGSLMEINSTHVYFRNRIMLCFNNEKQNDKSTFKDNSKSEYFINGVVCY